MCIYVHLTFSFVDTVSSPLVPYALSSALCHAHAALTRNWKHLQLPLKPLRQALQNGHCELQLQNAHRRSKEHSWVLGPRNSSKVADGFPSSLDHSSSKRKQRKMRHENTKEIPRLQDGENAAQSLLKIEIISYSLTLNFRFTSCKADHKSSPYNPTHECWRGKWRQAMIVLFCKPCIVFRSIMQHYMLEYYIFEYVCVCIYIYRERGREREREREKNKNEKNELHILEDL